MSYAKKIGGFIPGENDSYTMVYPCTSPASLEKVRDLQAQVRSIPGWTSSMDYRDGKCAIRVYRLNDLPRQLFVRRLAPSFDRAW